MSDYLVTGAAGGMGSAICRELADRGAKVWGIDGRDAEKFAGEGFFRADLTKTEELKRVFEELSEKSVTLDGVIHAAGIYDLDSLVEIEESSFIRDFDVNLFGIYRTNRIFLPLFKEKSRVVIISSELAPLRPLPFTGIYAVTKAAVEKYAEALRMELQLPGHSVTVIRPGAVNTGMLPASVKKLDSFTSGTKLYSVSAARFRKIVESVESKSVPPEKLSRAVLKALFSKRPRLTYCVNRNPLLLLFGLFPERFRLFVIKKILS
ncbi:MAG: SDR family NAD(P)-dependent oxidoreductase [Clostridia bacterium]|nr:SDR family NAD(P)-dependent oxidoreductase [Clostridia bacterium]